MKYKVLSGSREGATVTIVSQHSQDVFNVRLVPEKGSMDLEFEFQIERSLLQPILNVGSKVSIKGVSEKTYWVLGVEGIMVFFTPTKPEWGVGHSCLSADKLEEIEEKDPVYEVGSLVAIKGYPEMVYKVVTCENGTVTLRPENDKLGFSLPSHFLYPV